MANNAFANVAAAQTDSVLVAAVPGHKIKVKAVVIHSGASPAVVTFNSKGAGAGTPISPLLGALAIDTELLPYNPDGWFETNVGEALTVTTGAGSTTGILVSYSL